MQAPTSLYFEMKAFTFVSQACPEFPKADSRIIISKREDVEKKDSC